MEIENRRVFYKIKLSVLKKIVMIVQYGLILNLVILLLQILLNQSYLLILLKSVIFISYILSGILLTLLAVRIVNWLRLNHNGVGIIYTLAIATLAVNSFLVFIYLNTEYSDNSPLVRSVKSPTGVFATADAVLQPTYLIISVFSFILTWSATVFLLKNYSSRLGKIWFWILVTIPLAYFLSQFQSIFLYTFSEFRTSDPVLFGVTYNLFLSATKPIGALLFGVGFWSISKKIQSSAVRNYLMICAYGVSLLFTANQPLGLIYAPYPPFGLVTICFMGLSSNLFYVGIYSASVSVAEDRKLRQTMRSATIKETTKFLDSFGTSEMIQEVERRVISVSQAERDDMERETGVSSSFDHDEIRKYVQEVLQEVKKERG